jgi:hypothetical protein
LVIANHVGWWDGFWVMYLNMKKFHKKFYFMMLEKQLKNHWFFGYTGGYPVKKRSHEIIDCLNYTSDLLYDSNNMVLMFPQGNLESIYQHEFVFEKGVERVIRKSKEFTEIIFVANLIDFYKKPKPSLFINYIVYGNGETDIKSIQEAYNKFYNNTLNKHKKMNRG